MNKKLIWWMIAVICIIVLLAIGYNAYNNNQFFKLSDQLTTEDNSIVLDGIYKEVSNLRYETIINYCKTKGLTNVSNADIDRAIMQLANDNDTTKITKSSFLLTIGQLDMRFNELLWPATHNSFSNDPDGTAVVSNYLSKEDTDSLGFNIVNAGNDVCTENQKLSIKDQLGRGIRMIDLDIGPRMNLDNTIVDSIGSLIKNAFEKGWEGFVSLFKGKPKTPSWDWKDILGDIKVDWSIEESYHRIGFLGRTSLNTSNKSIKDFLDNNPNEIAIVRISDLYDGVFGNLTTDDNNFYLLLNKYLDNLKSNGMLHYVSNYYGDDNVPFDKMYQYIIYPGETANGHTVNEWPLIKDMILSNKRLVLLLPTHNVIKGDKATASKNTDSLSFTSPSGGSEKPYATSLSRVNISDSKANEYKDSPYRVLKADLTRDNGVSAGSYEAGKQNNNGRRIYELSKGVNDILKSKGVDRYINFIGLDYFMGNKSKGGIRDVDVVDAANRINLENSGHAWDTVLEIDKNLYWNYFSREKSLGINSYIKDAETNISGYDGNAFIDKNVWTGTESQNIKDKHLTVNFSQRVMVSHVYLNFFAYRDSVPMEIKAWKDGKEYNIGWFEIKQNQLQDWYEIPLQGYYECDKISVYFRGDAGIHFKEIGFKGGLPDSSLKTLDVIPTEDSYVLWGDHIGKNYHYDDYRRQNLEMYKSSDNARHVFMKFNMNDLRAPDKDVQKAYFVFKVTDLDRKVDITVREDRDATDWKADTLTGNIAKHFDDHKDVKYFNIQSNGYVKVDVTDGIKNYINSFDQDGLMTFRIYTNQNEWFVIKSSETSDKPRLEIHYKPIVIKKQSITLQPEQATFVKWGGFSKYNYGNQNILEIYESNASSQNTKTTFLKFGLEKLIGKKIVSAKLEYTLQVGKPTIIAIREDVDATNWEEMKLNGNAAKYFDVYNMVASELRYDKTGTYSVDVTNLISDFVSRGDEDNKMTFRIYQPKHSEWTYIHHRRSESPPKLIVTYSD